MLWIMLFADYLNFSNLSFDEEFAYSTVAMALTFLFTLIYQELGGKRFKLAVVISYLLSLSVYLIAIFYIIYAVNFHTKISEDIIFALEQTNINESIEYTSQYISPLLILGSILFSIFLGFLLIMQERKEKLIIDRSILVLIIIIAFFNVKYHKNDIRLYYFAKKAAINYKKELSLFQEMQNRRKNNEISFSAQKSMKGETYVIVIGESLSKQHMALYGYHRNTSPLLKKDEFIKFNNAYSNHIYTMPTLGAALTEKTQYNHKKFYDSLSIINILNKADIETYWLTNQRLLGIKNNIVSLIAHDADHLKGTNNSMGKNVESDSYDEALIPLFKEALNQESNKTKVIFLHLMGNHASFNKRYPQNYAKFSSNNPQLTSKVNDMVNTYDNSILYNDYVVDSLYQIFKKNVAVGAFLYTSDHALDLNANPVRSTTKFTYEMVQIPLLISLSDGYIKRYQKRYTMLNKHTFSLFSNDMLYDTILGLTAVSSDHYDAKNDLTSSQYHLDPSSSLVLDGQIPYLSDKNKLYNKMISKDASNKSSK